MKRLLHTHDRSSASQQENNAAGPAPDSMGDTVERTSHPKTLHIPLRSFSLFWIILFITTLLLASGLVPQSPSLPQVAGNGGMSVGKPICGKPLQVVHHFGITNPIGVPYTALTIPTSAQLALLPSPVAGNPVSYNPQTSILCALNAVALQSAWLTINPIVASLPTAMPTSSTTSGAAPPPFQSGSTNLWSQGALDALGGVWNGLYHWAGQTITYVEDWATATLGFLWVTPAALTYKNHVVQVGVAWMLGLMDGLLMLSFVWQGFQYMLTHDLNRSTQLKIAAAGILGGTMIVLLAINLAPEFVKLILNN